MDAHSEAPLPPLPHAADLLRLIPELVDLLLAALQGEEVRWSGAPDGQTHDEHRRAVERALALALGAWALPASPLGGAPADTASHKEPPGPPGNDRTNVPKLLFDALVGEEPLPAEEFARLARAAGWTAIPQTVLPVALAPSNRLTRTTLPGALWGTTGPHEPCLLLPDPTPQTEAALRDALRQQSAAVGPVVAAAHTGSALRWARSLLYLTQERQGRHTGVVHVTDHLTTLLLLQDELLSQTLSVQYLRPLDDLPRRRRDRLSSTLLAWLQEGSATEAAQLLQVHPQTVRYRMRQIENLFGNTLHQPQYRFELELALRCRHLIHHVRQDRSRAWRRAARAANPLPRARDLPRRSLPLSDVT